MTIIVRELTINANLVDEPGNDGRDGPGWLSEADMEEIISECVDRTLNAIKESRER